MAIHGVFFHTQVLFVFMWLIKQRVWMFPNFQSKLTILVLNWNVSGQVEKCPKPSKLQRSDLTIPNYLYLNFKMASINFFWILNFDKTLQRVNYFGGNTILRNLFVAGTGKLEKTIHTSKLEGLLFCSTHLLNSSL